MSFRTKLANWLLKKAEKVAIEKGNAVKKFHHDDRRIEMEFIERGKPGEGLHYDGTDYVDSVVYLGGNANPSYIDPNGKCDECESEGQVIHSQLFKSMLQADSEEKFFSDNLKKWCKLAAYGGGAAAVGSVGAIITVIQVAG